MPKKKTNSDLNNARIHFQTSAKEWIIGTAFLTKGIKEITKNKKYRKQLFENSCSLIDKGLSIIIEFAESMDKKDRSGNKDNRKPTKKSRKIKIE